jgi:hypothetical protein
LQSICIVVDFFLLFSIITNYFTLELILFYGAIVAILTTICRPFNQAILPEIFEKDDIPKILGINSMLFNLFRIFVPLLIGLLIGSEPILMIFILSLSILSLISYGFLRLKFFQNENKKISKNKSFILLFKEQGEILKKYPELQDIFSTAFILSATLGCYTFLIPALNDYLHQGDPVTLTYLYGIAGSGTLLAGLFKSLGKINLRKKAIPLLGILASILMIFFIYSLNFYIESLALFGLSFTLLVAFISCNQSVYELMPHENQGRVSSLLGLLIFGIAPFSNALTGFLVSLWGLQIVCSLYAIICGITSLGILLLSRLRAKKAASLELL